MSVFTVRSQAAGQQGFMEVAVITCDGTNTQLVSLCVCVFVTFETQHRGDMKLRQHVVFKSPAPACLFLLRQATQQADGALG